MRPVDKILRANEIAHLSEDDAVTCRAAPRSDGPVFGADPLYDALGVRVGD
jgi:hypothetical protein